MIVRSNDVAGTWPIVWPIFNKFSHLINVLTSDSLGDGESESDLNGDS